MRIAITWSELGEEDYSRFAHVRRLIQTRRGVTAWPLAARAQQGERVRRVGVLMNATAEEPEAQSYVAAFLGYVA
jgi:hypothetical protein